MSVKISITGRHMHLHDGVKSYAQQKASKLERYFDQLREIEIIFSQEAERKVVEMIATPRRGGRIVGQTEHDDQFAAVDLLIDKMYNQLHKVKEKTKENHKRSGRIPAPPLPSDEEAEEQLESYDEVVDKFTETL